jgi:hypothetical protein
MCATATEHLGKALWQITEIHEHSLKIYLSEVDVEVKLFDPTTTSGRQARTAIPAN